MPSSPPPPPVPPPVPPAGMGSLQSRQQRRAERRWRQQQLRLNRAQQRLQRRALRRRSVLGPLLLVALGGLLLITQGGLLSLPIALAALIHWWPLVLVVAGCVLVAEWAWDRRLSPHPSPGSPRRLVGGFAVVFLVLLTFIGWGASWLQQGPLASAIEDSGAAKAWGLDQLSAFRSARTFDFAEPLPASGALRIQNYRGNIAVSGTSEDGQVHVSVRQRVAAWRPAELRTREAEDKPTLALVGGQLLFNAEGQGRDDADLAITTPHNTQLQISPEQGDVSVSEFRGSVEIQAHRGNIELTGLTGNVDLALEDADATTTAHSVTGELKIAGHAGDIAISDLDGPLTLQGDLYGTTHLEHISGPVRLHSSFTEFASAALPGDLEIEGRTELHASGLQGPVVVTTSGRHLTLDGVQRGLTVQNSDGSVEVSFAEPVSAAKVTTTGGSIDVTVPEHTAFQVQAATVGGEIEDDFHLSTGATRQRLRGQIGVGGPLLQLQTNAGNITLHRAEQD